MTTDVVTADKRAEELDLLAGKIMDAINRNNPDIAAMPWRFPTEAKQLLGTLSALQSDSRPLVEFARWAIQQGSWDGHDIDGGDIQEIAEALGLITKVPYDPKVHGYSDIAEPGDDWYVFGPLIADKRGET